MKLKDISISSREEMALKEFIKSCYESGKRHYNLKKMFSRPDVLNTVVRIFSRHIREKLICPVDSGISPLAEILSDRTHLRSIYLNGIEDAVKKNASIVGEFKKNEKIHLVDDVIGTGETALRTIRLLRRNGLNPTYLTVILNVDITNSNTKALEINGVRVEEIFNIKNFV